MKNQNSEYKLRKRIKELEQEVESLRSYKSAAINILDWLIPFAGDAEKKDKVPNAAYGIRIITSRCMK